MIDLEELKKTLQKEPRNSNVLRQLGRHYLSNGYYKQARDEYHLAQLFSPHVVAEIMLDHEDAIKSDKNDIQARFSLISFCLAVSEIDAAVLELEELLDVDPKNLQAYNILGRIYIKSERIDEAMALLEKALKLNISDLSISEMLASVYLEKKRYEEAVHFYEELPRDKKNLRTLAELYTLLNKFEAAAEKYSLMYEGDPEVAAEAQIKLEELLLKDIASLRIREILADIYIKTIKPDLAVRKLMEILKIAPQKADEMTAKLRGLLKSYPLHPEATALLAENLANKGNYSEATEEYYKLIKNNPELIGKAVSGCKVIIEKYPDQFLARQFLIDAHLIEEKFDEAAAGIRQLLKDFPDAADWVISKCRELAKKNPVLKECIGYAQLAKGDYSAANLEAENLLAQNRGNIAALLLLGEVFLRQKLCRKAAEIFHKALNVAPYDAEIHKKYREAKLKELELEALEFKKRVAEDEWKISLHFDLAKNLLARGEKDEALREFQIAAKDANKAPLIYSLLGDFFRNDGLYDQSLDAFKKALQAQTDAAEQKKIKFGMALTYEAQGQARLAIKLLEEIEQVDIDFPGLRGKIKFLKNTNLLSLQNKTLVLIVKNADKGEVAGMWGRESKRSGPRNILSVSFGQNYNNSGIEFFSKGMHQAAEEEFTLSSQLDPHYAAGLNNLAVAQLINKKMPEALINFRNAYELEPAFAVILNNLGVALFLSGQAEEAEQRLTTATRLDPELTQAKLNLADVLYAMGKVKEAIGFYRQILPSDIMYDLAQQRLMYKVA